MGETKLTYVALQNARGDIKAKFNEMLENMKEQKNKVVVMNSTTWQGDSGNVFLEVFEENEKRINAERDEFDRIMQTLLEEIFNTFSDEEQQQIKKAQELVN